MPPYRRRRAATSDSEDSSAPTRRSRQPSTSTARRRATSNSASASSRDPSPPADISTSSRTEAITLQTKLLVRLALSSEVARVPIRRQDINTRCGTTASTFKQAFEHAQLALRETFGMELVELPSREKVTIKERLAATQAVGKGSSGTKSWVLSSTLVPEMRAALAGADAGVAGAGGATCAVGPTEASYVGLYSFVVTIIWLAGGKVTDALLERHLRTVNADASTPVDLTPKLLERMRREGYIDRKVDTSSGEQVVEYVVGPRGKIEVGEEGVAGLVGGVYGELEADEEDDLKKRIEKSLRMGRTTVTAITEEGEARNEGAMAKGKGKQKRTRAELESDEDD